MRIWAAVPDDEPDDDGSSNIWEWLGLLLFVAIGGVFVAVGAVLLAFAISLFVDSAFARDNGQWSDSPVNVREWFQTLKRPDNPSMSCCGEADAFEADNFEVAGDNYVAIITDGKGVIAPGTRIRVPNEKMKWDRGNPTGHGIIFLGTSGQVYCYVAPGGT